MRSPEGHRRLGLDLYHQYRSSANNLLLSPYSVWSAMGMVYGGAAGNTRSVMEKSLGYSPGVHSMLSELTSVLESRSAATAHQLNLIKGEPWHDPGSTATPESFGFHLKVANGLWRQTGYACKEAYLQLLAQVYACEPGEVDFAGDPHGACDTANRWVSEHTAGKIPKVLDPELINELTRLLLANVIYFKARWEDTFAARLTEPGPFHRLDGTDVEVQMMRQQEWFSTAQETAFDAVELPYIGRELSMVVVLPADMRAFENSLDTQTLEGIVAKLAPSPSSLVQLTMPRFRIESDLQLRTFFESLGMSDLFSAARADLSMISSEPGFHLDEVLHKTFIEVDEEGTEAAAVTMPVVMSLEPKVIEITLDRPFLFLIRDRETATWLFLGRVGNPE